MLSIRDLQIYFLRFTVISVLYTVVKHVIIDFPKTTRPLIDDGDSDNFLLPSTSLATSFLQNHDNHLANSSDRRRHDGGSADHGERREHPGQMIDDVIAMQFASVIDNGTSEFTKLFGSECLTDKLGSPPQVARTCGHDSVNISLSSRNSERHCERLTCLNIIYDIAAADNLTRIASEFMTSHPVRFPTDRELAAQSGNKCDLWRQSYGFNDLPPVSKEEADFPLAFNILAHKDVHQVVRLLRALYRPHNFYCIHIDAKSSADFRNALTSFMTCFDNVHFATKLERIVYAGYSRLQADINCMSDHLKSRTRWRYLINTAAQAFPLRTNAEMVKILRLYNGANDIEGIYGHRILHSRFVDEWIENPATGDISKNGKKNPPPPHNIDIVRGSAYGVFSYEFVRFIITDKRARDLLRWSQRTYSPDEFYWSTLHHTYSNPHLHTPGAFSGYPSKKEWLAVYANWGELKCYGHFVRGVCVFGVGDIPHLVRRKEFFVNKFHIDFQPLALDCLEAWLRHKELCPPPFDHDYYSKLEFIPKPVL